MPYAGRMQGPHVSTARRALLERLLPHKTSGSTLDELAAGLGISRTAAHQHVTALERDGLVEERGTRRTGGRPSRTYGLTEAGYERFARRYDLLARSMMEAVLDTAGEPALEGLFTTMADDLADEMAARVEGTAGGDRVAAVVAIMNELGYDAEATDTDGIAASNCIYHRLASRTRAVCRFDVRVLARLLGGEVEHGCCMQDGADRCTFRVLGTADGDGGR